MIDYSREREIYHEQQVDVIKKVERLRHVSHDIQTWEWMKVCERRGTHVPTQQVGNIDINSSCFYLLFYLKMKLNRRITPHGGKPSTLLNAQRQILISSRKTTQEHPKSFLWESWDLLILTYKITHCEFLPMSVQNNPGNPKSIFIYAFQ